MKSGRGEGNSELVSLLRLTSGDAAFAPGQVPPRRQDRTAVPRPLVVQWRGGRYVYAPVIEQTRPRPSLGWRLPLAVGFATLIAITAIKWDHAHPVPPP